MVSRAVYCIVGVSMNKVPTLLGPAEQQPLAMP